MSSCATVEVAKEVAKATNSLKATVDNMIDSIEKDKEILEVEKEEEKKLIIEQKKITMIDFSGNNLNEIKLLLGQEDINRIDGNTQTLRYDSASCRLFLFFNITLKVSRVEYFEIRNSYGKLITSKDEIENCYRDFSLS